MKFSKKFTALFLLLQLFFCVAALAQSLKQEAIEKAQNATELINQHKYEEGIKMLQEARKLDASNYKFLYEMGLAYYFKKDFSNSILVFNQLVKMPSIDDDCYVAYGNALEDNGQKQKALQMYQLGLQKFPQSGNLFYQIGIFYLTQNDFNKAVDAFENGIEAEPMFSLNYYRAAKLYCYSNEEAWGMVYGEIFLNLNRNSKYSAEISKLLYDTYLSEIKFTSDSTLRVGFSQEKPSTSNLNPFGTSVYEPTLLEALVGTKFINMNSLDKVRTKFLDVYFKKNFSKQFPNVLFSYQNKVKNAGHLEAYNHWVLNKGNETIFSIWLAKNKEKWDSFIEWYKSNPIEINNQNVFCRKKFQ